MATTKQKTWVELLGLDVDSCCVYGRRIVRNCGDDNYSVVWICDTVNQAFECYKAWQAEVASVVGRQHSDNK